MSSSNSEKTQKLLDAVKHRCAFVLKIAEDEVGHAPQWRSLRGRLLGVFGESGLSRDVRRIMNDVPGDSKAGCRHDS